VDFESSIAAAEFAQKLGLEGLGLGDADVATVRLRGRSSKAFTRSSNSWHRGGTPALGDAARRLHQIAPTQRVETP
jgi:hypothetical protein